MRADRCRLLNKLQTQTRPQTLTELRFDSGSTFLRSGHLSLGACRRVTLVLDICNYQLACDPPFRWCGLIPLPLKPRSSFHTSQASKLWCVVDKLWRSRHRHALLIEFSRLGFFDRTIASRWSQLTH